MADYFDQQPNFTNPSYATPEQLAQQRAYAAELMKRSGGDVNRPAGALANMIDALTGNLTRNNANQIQQQAAAGNAGNFANVISQLQGGHKVDPGNLATIIANPLASPEQRAVALKLMSPELITSGFGQPGYASPSQGVQAPPIRGAYTPAAPVSQSTEGTSITGPQAAPQIQRAPLDAVSPQGGVFGGMNSRPANWQSGMAPAAPAIGPNGVTAQFPSLEALAAKGRELKAKSEMAQGQNVTMKQDYEAATSAPAIKRVAGMMRDELSTAGDNMNMGPSAELHTNIKKIIANYAPGAFTQKQIEGLASQDSFEKLSTQLASMVGSKSSGTDAQLIQSIKSVPGQHNSREGADALLRMTMAVADQQIALRQATRGMTGDGYESARNAFFADPKNRVINPITGHPIEQDISAENTNKNREGISGGFKVLKVH